MTNYFETRTRDNGETFVTRTDDAPDWLADAVRAAHDDEFPNDWRYVTCRAIFEAFEDGSSDPSEVADSLVDVYTADLFEWLAGDLGRSAYVDEAMTEGLTSPSSSIEERIRLGQYLCIEAMVRVLAEAVDDNAEDDDEDMPAHVGDPTDCYFCRDDD